MIAVGLAGIRREGISRGAVLVAEADDWPVTMTIDAEISLDADASRGLSSRTRVRILKNQFGRSGQSVRLVIGFTHVVDGDGA